MDIDIDVYFWMVDRGVFDDDQRNRVDMERNKVNLFREHSQRFENGVYIGKLMLILKKSVVNNYMQIIKCYLDENHKETFFIRSLIGYFKR